MKKKVTVAVTSEIEVDSNWYENGTNKGIEEAEKMTYMDWFLNNIKDIKITVKKA